MGLLRRHLPVKNDNDGLNINVVVQVHSQQVKEEWKVPHKPVKVRLPNLDPLRFQKFDFYHNATLVESPRLTAFLTDVATIQGKQSAISKVSIERPPRIPGYNVEAMWSHYDAEMRFFGCNQQNMGIILPAVRPGSSSVVTPEANLVAESSSDHSRQAATTSSAPSKYPSARTPLFLQPNSPP
jgi:hypothetical protein